VGAPVKLGILVTTYNRSAMLADCLRSLVAAAIPESDILVCDDASTDNTREVVAEFSRMDPRVRYYGNDVNQGGLPTVREAFPQLRGQYIMMTGDDDLVLPTNFVRKVAILDAHPEVGFVWSPHYVIDENGRNYGPPRRAEYTSYSYVGGRNEFLSLITGNYIGGQSVVFRRKLWEELGGYDESITQTLSDWELWLRYAYHTQTAFINEPLVMVRMLSQGLTQSKGMSEGLLALGMIDVWRKWLVVNQNPPALDPRTWHNMREMFMYMCRECFGDDAARHDQCRREFAQLESDYLANVTRGAARATRLGASRPRKPAASHPHVVLSGPVYEPSGYGGDSRSLAHVLAAGELPARVEEVRWRNLRLASDPNQEVLARLTTEQVPAEARHVYIWDTSPAYFTAVEGAAATIGRGTFFCDSLPDTWVERCNQLERVWVPSSFHRESFARAGVAESKLRVLPTCVDVERFRTATIRANYETGRGFNFLSVLSWDQVSGWDLIISAFVAEFAADEDVALALSIRSYGTLDMQQLQAEVQNVVNAAAPGRASIAPIKVWTNTLADAEMPALYRGANAYVRASRGEGWGRTLIEAMASGLPVISPAWGAAADIIAPDHAYAVASQEAPVPESMLVAAPGMDGARWAVPSVEDLRAKMRQVFRDRAQAQQIAAKGQAVAAKRFSPAAVTPVLRELLGEAL
jgi:glycosyltransferase involved in cell wall biosynthesis